jgi:Tfp pilus assembly protein PilN
MALHLNLFHELQKQERQRSRDPLRLGLYGIVAVIVVCIGYYFFRQQQVSAVTAQADQLRAEWARLEPKQAQAETQQAKLTADLKLRDDLMQYIEGRFYWGPVLQKIVEVVPKEAQITHLTASSPGSGDVTHPFVIQFAGIATGPQPRNTAERFRNALREKFQTSFTGVTSTFKALDDSSENVVVNGQPMPTVSFSIELDFLNVPPTVAPAPAAK